MLRVEIDVGFVGKKLTHVSSIFDQDPTAGDVTTITNNLISSTFEESIGHRIIAADYSMLEARVLAWLSGESQVRFCV